MEENSSNNKHQASGWLTQAIILIGGTFAKQSYKKWVTILDNEKRRLVTILFLTILTLLLLMGAVFFMSISIILFFWNSHRLASVIIVASLYLIASGLANWRLRILLKRRVI